MDKFHQMSDLPVPFDVLQVGLHIKFMTTYGISHAHTMHTFWFVVDAIDKHLAFAFINPTDHDNQRSTIAAALSEVSSAGFACCAGAVDGILI
jgi:hypothetical protein